LHAFRDVKTALPRVGLTGGIGSGKSEVGKIFADLGAFLINADLVAREVVVLGSEALRKILLRWPQVGLADGRLDREALAAVVFEYPSERTALNAIVHPYVRERMRAYSENVAPGRMIVYEVPLLFENGLYREMDCNVLVTAPVDQRIARLASRNGWIRDQIVRRMAAQIQPSEAEKLATHILRNDGSLDELRTKTKELYGILCTVLGVP
jgi:dephospho-CoA kinase